MSAGEKKYAKLELTEFEKTHDLILTDQEQYRVKRIKFYQNYIKKLKVATRADGVTPSRPDGMKLRNPQTNAMEIKDQGQRGYMPTFANQVAKNGSAEQKAEFAALIAMPDVKTSEQTMDYRMRMNKLRNEITPAPPVSTEKPARRSARKSRRQGSAASGETVTKPGQSGLAGGSSMEGVDGKAQIRNSSNPYTI